MNIQNNISLKPYNTFGIDVRARQFIEVTTREELKEALAFNQGLVSSEPFILGGGSNILLVKNINRLVIRNLIPGMEKVREDDDHVYINSGAGERWHGFVLYCLDNNYGGIENLALIPGFVGASPMQNIGAYGVELRDVFYSLTAIKVTDGEEVVFYKEDCEFGYRDSIFKNKYIDQFVITDVTFRLDKAPVFKTGYGAIMQEIETMDIDGLSIRAIAQAVINIRTSKLPDPAIIGNAGSFFKNPQVSSLVYDDLKKSFPSIVGYDLNNGQYKIAAGWLIESCGYKGFRKGDAGCHEKQALVLVNHGSATGQDILDLSEEIILSVSKKFGITMEREVNVV